MGAGLSQSKKRRKPLTLVGSSTAASALGARTSREAHKVASIAGRTHSTGLLQAAGPFMSAQRGCACAEEGAYLNAHCGSARPGLAAGKRSRGPALTKGVDSICRFFCRSENALA